MAESLAQAIRLGFIVETQIFLLNQMWKQGQSPSPGSALGQSRDSIPSTSHSQGWGQVMVLLGLSEGLATATQRLGDH